MASWDPIAALPDHRRRDLEAYVALLLDFNQHINLISRDDEEHVWKRHVCHCLYLTYRRFPAGSTVIDWGTGGGLPAVPLAIALPDVQFVAIDAVHKKVRAVRAIARRLDLQNLNAQQGRAETIEATASYSVSRATAPLNDLWAWHSRLRQSVAIRSETGCWKPGLVCLKGGDLKEEIGRVSAQVESISIASFTDDPYFQDKVIVACTPRRT